MLDAIEKAKAHGGKLVRMPGGFWTWDGCLWNGRAPEWWAGATTISALVDRGHMIFSEFKEGRSFRFPIAAALKDAEPIGAHGGNPQS